MNDAQIHSILFRGIISRLNNLAGEDGEFIHSSDIENPFELSVAYQVRPMERFPHNYERDKFLHSRDRYVIAITGGARHMLIRVQHGEHITIYRGTVQTMFGDKSDKAMDILDKLIHKFYENVDVQDRQIDVSQVDLSSGMSSNNVRVFHES